MDNSPLARLEAWYQSQCDGDWEHCFGLKIETLDNPGWKVVIELDDTELEDAPFAEVKRNEVAQRYEDDPNWLWCRKQGSKFDAIGGPKQLGAIIEVFLSWVEAVAEPSAA
jgi:hypothetical protein